MELGILLLYLILIPCAASYSRRKGHSVMAAVIGSILISPVIVMIITAFTPVNEDGLVESGRMKRCRSCQELVRPGAERCRFCGAESR